MARLSLAVALLAALIGLVGCLGAFSPAADSLNYLTPVWLAVGLVAAIPPVVRHRRWMRRCGLAAVVILVATGGMNLHRGAPARQTGGPVDLRIVQFNVTKRNLAPAEAAGWIAAQGADIVVLEEAAVVGAQVRDRLESDYPFVVDCVGARDRCSTAILSRRPPVRSGGLARDDPENRKGLSAAWATFADGKGEFTVVGVHMGRPWPYGDQTASLLQLGAFLLTPPRDRLIVVGDFNQPPWTFAMQRQDREIGLSRLTGSQPTWPVRHLPIGVADLTISSPTILPIDHAYAGRDWAAVRVTRGPDIGSEHRPLVIDLARREAP